MMTERCSVCDARLGTGADPRHDEADCIRKATAHHYMAKLRTGAVYVAIKTWFGPPLVDGEELDRAPRWQALIDTETTARAVLMGDSVPVEVDGETLRNLEGIDEPTYRFMVSDAGHAQQYRPDDPKANPRRRIDWANLKLPF